MPKVPGWGTASRCVLWHLLRASRFATGMCIVALKRRILSQRYHDVTEVLSEGLIIIIVSAAGRSNAQVGITYAYSSKITAKISRIINSILLGASNLSNEIHLPSPLQHLSVFLFA